MSIFSPKMFIYSLSFKIFSKSYHFYIYTRMSVSGNFRHFLEMTVKNCHLKGLHAMTYAKMGKFSNKLFVVTPDQVIYQNQCPFQNPKNWDFLSLPVHQHRTDIEIVAVTGTVWNIQFEQIVVDSQSCLIHAYQLKQNKDMYETGGFKKLSDKSVRLKNRKKLSPGDRLKMKSNELHTVYVPKGETASWLILESQATGSYDGIVYANYELEKWSSKDLYQKPTKQQVIQYLSIAGIKFDEREIGDNISKEIIF